MDSEKQTYFGCAVNSFYMAATYLKNEDGAQTKVGKTTYNYDTGWGVISRTINTETLQEYIDSVHYSEAGFIINGTYGLGTITNKRKIRKIIIHLYYSRWSNH